MRNRLHHHHRHRAKSQSPAKSPASIDVAPAPCAHSRMEKYDTRVQPRESSTLKRKSLANRRRRSRMKNAGTRVERGRDSSTSERRRAVGLKLVRECMQIEM